jgi:dGTPase
VKFGVYPDDRQVFEWLRQGAPEWTTPMECQVMDLSDDIAYSVHDVEDAIVGGSFDPITLTDPKIVTGIVEVARDWYGQKWDADKLEAAFTRLRDLRSFPDRFTGTRHSLATLKNMTSALIGRFASSVEHATRARHGEGPLTRYSAGLVIPEETSYEIVALKGISVYFVMAPNEKQPFHDEQLAIVTDLVEVMMRNDPKPSDALETVFLEDWDRAGSYDERLRVAIDQVASLTDGSALALHSILC